MASDIELGAFPSASVLETLEVYRKQIELHAKEIKSLQEALFSNKAQPQKEETKTLTRLVHVFTTSPWCYGLTQFVRSNVLFFQMLWLLAMVFSVSVATLFISNTINDYYSYKVITQAKIMQNDSIVMPQITVCQYANVSDAAYEIKYCWFEGLNCSSEYMFVELFLKNGEKRRCLRFNGGRNSSGHIIPPKSQHGVSTSENKGFNIGLNALKLEKDDYNLVFIEEISERTVWDYSSAVVEFKSKNSIELDQENDQKLGMPYNNCLEEEQLSLDNHQEPMVLQTLKFNRKYKKEKCYFLCFLREMTEQYNCSFPRLYERNGTGQSCYEIGHDLLQLEYKFDYDTCSSVCPDACSKKIYETYTYHSFNQNYADSFFNLRVYFTSTHLLDISQYPKTTWADLMSKIGGTLGFFVGLRLLSFIDIFQFCVEALCLLAKKLYLFIQF